MRRECSECGREPAQFLCVILCSQMTGKDGDGTLFLNCLSQQFSRNASARPRVYRNPCNSIGPGCITGDAHYGSPLLRQAADDGVDAGRVARRDNDSVVVASQINLHQFRVAISQTRVSSELQIHIHAVCRRAYPCPQRRKKRGNLLRKINGDSQPAVKFQTACGNVRPIVKFLGHL
jgi:hypothetical protein